MLIHLQLLKKNKEVRERKQPNNVSEASSYSCAYRTCIRNIIFSDEVLVDLSRRENVNASSQKTELIGFNVLITFCLFKLTNAF